MCIPELLQPRHPTFHPLTLARARARVLAIEKILSSQGPHVSSPSFPSGRRTGRKGCVLGGQPPAPIQTNDLATGSTRTGAAPCRLGGPHSSPQMLERLSAEPAT